MTTKTLMIQGTTSHAGKSIFVAALCRIFNNKGFIVAPFKSQNMSLNSYVTKEGAEIARSQVVQAWAARIEPRAEFNPILLKPKGNQSSQIVLLGKPYADYKVHEYYSKYIPKLIPHIKNAILKLSKEYDLIIVEGAGSPAEINLMERDIANMYVAKLMNAPVILIADIDRGGVFASIYGTIKLLNPEDQKRIKYFVINKFRGDVNILKPGIEQLETLIGIKCIGVIPYVEDLKIPSEDSISLEDHKSSGELEVKVIRLPRISNFNDYEILSWEPAINVSYISEPEQLRNADVIIIPGTKNTVKDLEWLRKKGFIPKLKQLKEENYFILGICGGYQMLGSKIIDMSIESNKNREYEGLNLLEVITEFSSYEKITKQVQAEMIGIPFLKGTIIKGYEIHMGIVKLEANTKPLLNIIDEQSTSENEFTGAINESQNVIGCFMHGLWDSDEFRKKFIEFLYFRKNLKLKKNKSINYQLVIDKNIEKFASVVENNIDMKTLINLIE